MAPTYPSAKDRFFAQVEKTETCWLWIGKRAYFDRGRLLVDGKVMFAHRFSWTLHNGPIPDGLCVLHKCDVSRCVNPDHLFLGTQLDNMADREAKGRGPNNPKGEDHRMATLTDREVLAIRDDNRALSVIAKEYGVTYSVIWTVKTRRTWRHLKEAAD